MNKVSEVSGVINDAQGIISTLLDAVNTGVWLSKEQIDTIVDQFDDVTIRDTALNIFARSSHEDALHILKSMTKAGVDHYDSNDANPNLTGYIAIFTAAYAGKNVSEGKGNPEVEALLSKNLTTEALEAGCELSLLKLVNRMYDFNVPVVVFFESITALSLEESAQGA